MQVKPEHPPAETSALPPIEVLIVDDEATSRGLVRQFLAQLPGVEPVTASDGLEALEKVLSRPIELALIDIHMPGVDGIELLTMIRSNPTCARLPVVVVSADDTLHGVGRAVSLGILDYIVKPFEAAAITRRLGRAVDQVRRRRSDVSRTGGLRCRILLAESSAIYRSFVVSALSPYFDVETVDTPAMAMISALRRPADLILVGASFGQSAIDALREKTNRLDRKPRIVRLADSSAAGGSAASVATASVPTVSRSAGPGVLLAQVVKLLLSRKDSSGESLEPTIEPILRAVFRRYLAACFGEFPEAPYPAGFGPFESCVSCEARGFRDGSTVRLEVEFDSNFAPELNRALGLDDSNGDPSEIAEGVCEALDLLKNRLQCFCDEDLTWSRPRVAASPCDSRPAWSFEAAYRRGDLRILFRCSSFA